VGGLLVVTEGHQVGLGQSLRQGLSVEGLVRTRHGLLDLLELFEGDPATRGIALIGEIGGEAEEEAAEFIRKRMTRPVAAFISGRTAPQGKRMGHAGAIISGGMGTPEAKIKAFAAAGVPVADRPDQIPELLAGRL